MLFFKELQDGFLIREEGQAVKDVSALSSHSDFKTENQGSSLFFCT